MKARHISQSALEFNLWNAAVLLHGYIDAGDYKQFIFPLLFYKRQCDVYVQAMIETAENGKQTFQRILTLRQEVDALILHLSTLKWRFVAAEELPRQHSDVLVESMVRDRLRESLH